MAHTIVQRALVVSVRQVGKETGHLPEPENGVDQDGRADIEGLPSAPVSGGPNGVDCQAMIRWSIQASCSAKNGGLPGPTSPDPLAGALDSTDISNQR